jgi:hypothetical protein
MNQQEFFEKHGINEYLNYQNPERRLKACYTKIIKGTRHHWGRFFADTAKYKREIPAIRYRAVEVFALIERQS